MTQPASLAPVALSALSLPAVAGGAVPDEIMILPAPLSDMRTVDGRGPFRLHDVAGVIARSMGLTRNGGKLPIDVNHMTRKLGSAGFEAPARGWITELFARDGAMWARVQWTEAGRAMVAAGEYLSISPEIIPDRNGEVLQVLGASLTNDPALLGLATLTTRETPMNDLLQRLAAKLGKPETATAEECLTAIPDPAATVTLTALQGEVAALCGVLGAKDLKEAMVAVRGHMSASTQVESLTSRLAAVELAAKRQVSDAWMAGEIAGGRGIPPADREELVLLHMENPDRAKKFAALHPRVSELTHLGGTPPGAGGVEALTSGQITAKASQMIAERKAAGIEMTFIEAVQAVTDGSTK